MDFSNTIKNLCNNAVSNKVDIIKKDSSEFELKKLELQMNKHLKGKKGLKFNKVSIFNFDEKKDYNESSFNNIIDKEIKVKYNNKKWSTLPLYMKWNLILVYLSENNITDSNIINKIKKNLNNNTINLTYDNINNKIINIII